MAQSQHSQAFKELLEQARQASASLENERRASGRLTGPSFQTLEIATGPAPKAQPNSTWETAARQRSRSLSFNEIVSPVELVA